MEFTCSECQAKYWKNETNAKNIFSNCCKNGKVKLPQLDEPPKYLRDLLDNNNQFKNNIRAYNSIFAFASLGANIDKKLIEKKGNYCFRIHGNVYHYMGSLLPQQKEDAKFAQIYL